MRPLLNRSKDSSLVVRYVIYDSSVCNVNTSNAVSFYSSPDQVSKAKEVARLERLQQEADAERKAREFKARPMPRSLSRSTPSSAHQSPILLGLNILSHDTSVSSIDKSGSENVEPQFTTPRNNQASKSFAYEPHSTIRAKKRASFDERRALHEIEREQHEERLRQSTIKSRRAELSKLRESLR